MKKIKRALSSTAETVVIHLTIAESGVAGSVDKSRLLCWGKFSAAVHRELNGAEHEMRRLLKKILKRFLLGLPEKMHAVHV
jgi:hypothetical protein